MGTSVFAQLPRLFFEKKPVFGNAKIAFGPLKCPSLSIEWRFARRCSLTKNLTVFRSFAAAESRIYSPVDINTDSRMRVAWATTRCKCSSESRLSA